MQYLDIHIRHQQAILKVLEFYTGPIDGIWGPDTIEAKTRYEYDPSYEPALPSNGMPLSSSGPYPKNVYATQKGFTLSGNEEEINKLVEDSLSSPLNESQDKEPEENSEKESVEPTNKYSKYDSKKGKKSN